MRSRGVDTIRDLPYPGWCIHERRRLRPSPLSVPLLGIQKILLSHANHPMAKYFMTLIREDPTIDETAEAS